MTTGSPNTSITEKEYIFQRWHDAVVSRDLDGLISLYSEDAILEGPLVLIAYPEATSGVLHGRGAIRTFFEPQFSNANAGLGRWFRTGKYFANGEQLIWEYPRETPDGEQADLIEVMDISDRLIRVHKVFWGWYGVRKLLQSSGQNPRV